MINKLRTHIELPKEPTLYLAVGRLPAYQRISLIDVELRPNNVSVENATRVLFAAREIGNEDLRAFNFHYSENTLNQRADCENEGGKS